MRKLISLLMLILLLPMVLAQSAPTPIRGELTINGIKPNGYIMEVKNLDNPKASILTASNDIPQLKTENGVFAFDLGYFGTDDFGYYLYDSPNRRYAGDRIQVKVIRDSLGNEINCVNCVYTFNVPREFPYYFDFKIVDSTVKVIQTCVDLGCNEGYTCNRQSGSCEKVVVIPPVTEYVCSDGTKVESADKCPIETKEHADEMVKQILTYGGWTLALGFAGLYLYWRRKKQYARAEKMANTYIKRRKK